MLISSLIIHKYFILLSLISSRTNFPGIAVGRGVLRYIICVFALRVVLFG